MGGPGAQLKLTDPQARKTPSDCSCLVKDKVSNTVLTRESRSQALSHRQQQRPIRTELLHLFLLHFFDKRYRFPIYQSDNILLSKFYFLHEIQKNHKGATRRTEV